MAIPKNSKKEQNFPSTTTKSKFNQKGDNEKDSSILSAKVKLKGRLLNSQIFIKSDKSKMEKNSLVIVSEIKKEKLVYQMTPLEKMEKVKLGLSKHDLEKVKYKIKLDYDKLSKVLSVTRATLINKKGDSKFNASLSEKIIGLASIFSFGYDVFEDENKFNKWIFHPNVALGGKIPFEIMNNEFGREEVKNLIGRIEYGVYS